MSTLTVEATVQQVREVLSGHRFRGSNEHGIHAGMADAFAAAGLDAAAEVCLTPRDRVDFLIGRVALEVKTQGQRTAIWRQLARYAAHPDVDLVIILASTRRALLADLPDTLAGVQVVGLLLKGPGL